MLKKSAWPWVWMSVLVVILDQASKFYAQYHLFVNKPFYVFPFLNFNLQFNPGAAFSFLGNADGWQVFLFIGISSVVGLAVLIWLFRTDRANWFMALPLSLILGGAVGNLIDRIRYHYVVDFIDFHLGGWHFATFNVADSAISIGVALLLIKLVFFSHNTSR